MNNPHIEVRIKAQLSFRGGETKEKIKTLSLAIKAAEEIHTIHWVDSMFMEL